MNKPIVLLENEELKISTNSLFLTKNESEEVLSAGHILQELEVQCSQSEVERELAKQSARLVGYRRGKKHAAKAIVKEVVRHKLETLNAQQEQMARLESTIVDTAMLVVQKILDDKSSTEVIIAMTKRALAEINDNTDYVLHVSPCEYENVKSQLDDLNVPEELGLVTKVVVDPLLQPRECYLCWSTGKLHLNLQQQFEILHEFLEENRLSQQSKIHRASMSDNR